MRARTLLAIAVAALVAAVTASCIIGPKHDDPEADTVPTKDASSDTAFEPESAVGIDASPDVAPPPPSETAAPDTGPAEASVDGDASESGDAVSDGGDVGDTGGDG